MPTTDTVELLRAGSVVSSFAGAFGASMRETRVTAILGYLIALRSQPFCRAFGVGGTIESVRIEARHNLDRSDILIESTDGLAVIEAKIGAADPFKQSKKYPAKWRILITQYLPTLNQKTIAGVQYWRWREIAELIRENAAEFSKSDVRFVSDDLITYLKEYNMISDDEAAEIYARDLNSDETADFFLKGHLYGCPYAKTGRLSELKYFAPYFGRKVSDSHPGLQEGISYIAKIISVQVAETAEDFMRIATEVRKKTTFRGEQQYVEDFAKWFFEKRKRYSCAFLSIPRLAFNPPIQKPFLQDGRGFLNRHYYLFDEFYQAWGGKEIF
jgi:hypothetical protein